MGVWEGVWEGLFIGRPWIVSDGCNPGAQSANPTYFVDALRYLVRCASGWDSGALRVRLGCSLGEEDARFLTERLHP